MTKMIIVITKCRDYGQEEPVEVIVKSRVLKYLPDIYVFLRDKARYYEIKKMMQSVNSITYKNNQLHCNTTGK